MVCSQLRLLRRRGLPKSIAIRVRRSQGCALPKESESRLARVPVQLRVEGLCLKERLTHPLHLARIPDELRVEGTGAPERVVQANVGMF